MPSRPASGRVPNGRDSHFGPPMAPSKTASDARHPASVSGGSGTPKLSIALPPNANSRNSKWWPNAEAQSSSSCTAALVTSGPMPSPGKRAIVFRNAAMEKLLCVLAHVCSRGARCCGSRRGIAANLVDDADQIAIRDFLLGIGYRNREAVTFGKLGVGRLISKFRQARAIRVATRVLSQHQTAGRHADQFRNDDFVRQRILQDAVLVDAGLMCESVGAHDSLVWRHGNIR